MKHEELVLVIDFGAQYSQLIARRVREQNVYCEIVPFSTPIEKIKEMNPRALILSGGPSSIYDEDAPRADDALFGLGIPKLGICYGFQAMGYYLKAEVKRSDKPRIRQGNAECLGQFRTC